MAGKLEGKVALVTGGNSGIGLATAKRFAREGAFVFVTGRRQSELNDAVKAIGANAFGVQGDVARLADLDKLFAIIKDKKGRLDVVFANAGGGELVALGQITEEHFDKWFGINVKGLVFTVQKALPLMPDGGSIILNASTQSIKATPGFSIYSATKAAIRSLARNWTLDLKDRKIRVNALSPGPVKTPGLEEVAGGGDAARKFEAELAAAVPLGRLGDPDEIGKAAVFLASDDSSFITGAEIFVDGGYAQI